MNREQLAARLARMRQASDNRIAIWRVIVDAQFNVVRRIFRGYFVSQDAKARRPER